MADNNQDEGWRRMLFWICISCRPRAIITAFFLLFRGKQRVFDVVLTGRVVLMEPGLGSDFSHVAHSLKTLVPIIWVRFFPDFEKYIRLSCFLLLLCRRFEWGQHHKKAKPSEGAPLTQSGTITASKSRDNQYSFITTQSYCPRTKQNHTTRRPSLLLHY